jgi:hypothetical protein
LKKSGVGDDVSKKAAELSALGASKGGTARAARLSADERRRIAQQAAKARWGEEIHFAPYPGEIVIGDIVIPCAVLEDETRVLSQAAVLRALGRNPEKSLRAYGEDAEVRPPFVAADNLQEFITDDLRETLNPIRYRVAGDRQNNPSWGYQARLLPLICGVYIQAWKNGKLHNTQEDVAKAAGVLLQGLAHVGIEALVDEATGYQDVRQKNALAKILEAYIDKVLQPWVQTFPTDFYKELFRLRNLDWPKGSVQRPRYFGALTNDIVYRRLAPGVLEELKRVQDRDDSGRPKHKLFQRLTTNVGYPKLREHLGSVVTLMKLSRNWGEFHILLDRIHPKYGETMPLPFDDDIRDDIGTGL